MRDRELPDADTFLDAADEAFGYLRDAGFIVPHGGRVAAPTYDALECHGRHVVVRVSLDRRERCVDVGFTPSPEGATGSSEVRCVGLLAHAIKHGYRGGLTEFSGQASGRWFEDNLRTCAAALKVLAPDVLADSPTVFGEA